MPVVCCGNVTVGGSGKTTVALDLGMRLKHLGVQPHFLTRGYGGRARGPIRVDPGGSASAFGDEALLLATVAPTWASRDRAAGARQAVAAGADAIIMDDGLQNPGLARDFSLLVIDGAAGFGNGRAVPAGPLRECVSSGAARCQAAVLIGEDATSAVAALPARLPVLRARLAPGPEIARLAGRRVMAFAGIGRPAKFFEMLAATGLDVAEQVGFPDHHAYRASDVARLIEHARMRDLALATTPKDAVRLPTPTPDAIAVVSVHLVWERPDLINALLADVAAARRAVPGEGAPG